ncbi:MAG: hypothetical protein RL196_421 [Actinomycetota bacterium]|jgi:Flp pilus assembly protein TadG
MARIDGSRKSKPFRSPDSAENGSAVVDFVLTSFALLVIFTSAMAIITNLYLRTVLTNAATDAARLMARADISSTQSCESNDSAKLAAAAAARTSLSTLIGNKLDTTIEAATQKLDGLCTAVVRLTANLPGLPLMPNLTKFEATAHATLEFQ